MLSLKFGFMLGFFPTLMLLISRVGGLVEPERVAEYYRRNHTWPIEHYVPDTPGWKKLFDHRFRQVAEIEDYDQRYEGFLQTVNAGYVAPNFTEHGFGLARAPDDLMDALRQGIRDGLAAGPKLEPLIEVITGDRPWFIDRPDLTQRVLDELQHYSESWVGMELTAHQAYGFRLYRNNSQLQMHVDKSQTHIVSFILHIDSSDDAEPWPILIEDYNGKTHEVILTSGDILFYESSKCFHGRPHIFNGSWYSSIFVHYYPKYGWKETDHWLEASYAVPPQWITKPTHKFEIPLQMVATGMKEPTCPNDWCQSEHTIKWGGPAEHGYLMLPTGEKSPFVPKKIECKDDVSDCPMWASWSSNECKTNAGYMLVHCRKSCGSCTADNTNNNRADEL